MKDLLRALRVVGVGGVALGLISCGVEPSESIQSSEQALPAIETVAHVSAPIINGDPPSAPEHAAVVGLHFRSGNYVDPSPYCSGTLITEDVVLTAAHCLDAAKGGKAFKTMAPSGLAIYVGDRMATDSSPYVSAVVQTQIHPGYDRNALFNDIALVRLASQVPASEAVPVAALPPALGFTSGDVGNLVLNFAGFGDDENGQFGTKLQVDGVLGGLGCTVSGCYGADDPATQISYLQYYSGPCFGDSGGPAFVYRNGVPYVGGITSWGDAYCAQFGVSTRVDGFASYIAAFVNVDPGPNCSADGYCNPECGTTDPDCNGGPGGGSCGDGICGAGESCDGRSGTSACSSDCAGLTGGKPSKRYCYVEGTCQGPGCP